MKQERGHWVYAASGFSVRIVRVRRARSNRIKAERNDDHDGGNSKSLAHKTR